MLRENPKPVAEVTSQDKSGFFELSREKLLAKAVAVLGAAALASTAATIEPSKAFAHPDSAGAGIASHPLEYVGVTSNRIWVPDLDDARKAAQEIAATNANTVRIFQPYNPGRVEISSDLSRLCNAAEAAREFNLTPEISFIGFKGSNHNYVPSSAGEVSRYLNVAKTILLKIAGPEASKPGPNGEPPCVEQPLSKVIIEDFNEVNSSSFNSNQDAAKKYAYLVSRSIPAFDKIASDINKVYENNGYDDNNTPHFVLVHAVGGLAVGNHDPIGFLKDFDRELMSFDIKNPDFLLTLHPYPANPTTNPARVEANIYQPIRDELDSAWGEGVVPVFYDEIGVSAISPAKRSLYGSRSLQAAAVTEGLQAQYYKEAIVEASLEDGVVGVLTFQSQDVKNDGWPASTVNPDGSHKGSWNTVAQTFHDALVGTLNN